MSTAESFLNYIVAAQGVGGFVPGLDIFVIFANQTPSPQENWPEANMIAYTVLLNSVSLTGLSVASAVS